MKGRQPKVFCPRLRMQCWLIWLPQGNHITLKGTQTRPPPYWVVCVCDCGCLLASLFYHDQSHPLSDGLKVGKPPHFLTLITPRNGENNDRQVWGGVHLAQIFLTLARRRMARYTKAPDNTGGQIDLTYKSWNSLLAWKKRALGQKVRHVCKKKRWRDQPQSE